MFSKLLKHLICLSLLLQSPALLQAQNTLADFAGSYEGQLIHPATINTPEIPFGVITFTITTTGMASGKMALSVGKTYSFKIPLEFRSSNGSIINKLDVSPAVIAKGRFGLALLSLTLQVYDDGTFLSGGISNIPNTAVLYAAKSGSTRKLKVFPKTEAAPWTGTYTMAMPTPSPAGEDTPRGSGYATVKIAETGALKLAGKLGDGVAWTASAQCTEDGVYQISTNPYKTAGSYFNLGFQLVDDGNGGHHVDDESEVTTIAWKKVAKEKDKAYPEGFGELTTNLVLEPWQIPGKGETVASVQELIGTELNVSISDAIFEEDYADFLPSQLGLTDKNLFQILEGNGINSPDPADLKAWAKLFTGKVDPKTGKFTATLNIQDEVPGTGSRPKIIKRKVAIEGVMFPPVFLSGRAHGAGFMAIPPLDKKTETIVTDSFTLRVPSVVD